MLWLVVALSAAEENSAAASSKLVALLEAQQEGKPILLPEQRAYFDGLNDHLKSLLTNAAEAEILTRADHLGTLLSLGLRPQKMEVLLQDNCVLCHTDPEVQKPETLFLLSGPASNAPPHLNLHDLVDDVHFRRGLSCAGCHGGDPTSDKLEHTFVKEWPGTDRDKDRRWILSFCARCHSDPALMNQFNQALPTDQLAKYKDSPHGKLLLDGQDRRAPDCISCHGVHGIRGAKNPLSKVYPKRVHETCGACHASAEKMAGLTRPDRSPMPIDQVDEYRTSVHGRALLEKGDMGAPTCNDCHGNHTTTPAGLSSVNQSCGLCHAANSSLLDGSKHKLAFEKHNWAQCGECHGDHNIAKTHDLLLANKSDALCTKCHQEYAKDNPDCIATATYFHASITGMDQAMTTYTIAAEELAKKGLDVDPIHEKLNELADTLKQARSHIHSFSSNSFVRVAAPGEQAVQSMATLVGQAKAEYRLRQSGLAASIALIGIVMIALYLKLRRLEE